MCSDLCHAASSNGVKKKKDEDVFRKEKKSLIFDAQVHFAEQRGVWERNLPLKCDVPTFSVCINVSQKRRDDSGCQHFNLRLVMKKSGHITKIFCFLSIPEDFQLQISLFIFVFFCLHFLEDPCFLLGLFGLTFEKFLISDGVL